MLAKILSNVGEVAMGIGTSSWAPRLSHVMLPNKFLGMSCHETMRLERCKSGAMVIGDGLTSGKVQGVSSFSGLETCKASQPLPLDPL